MRNVLLLFSSAFVLSACARFEIAPEYNTYHETYENDYTRTPRVAGLAPGDTLTPTDAKELDLQGVGASTSITVRRSDGITGRASLGYIQFEEKEYDAVISGVPEKLLLKTHSAYAELAGGYVILDTSFLDLRPEVIVREQFYYFDSGQRAGTGDQHVAHEHIGVGLNIEFQFLPGIALGLRGAAFYTNEDNLEIKRAHSFSAAASLIVGGFGKGGGKSSKK